MRFSACIRLLLSSCLSVQALCAHAGFSITGSRVIFEEARGETTVRVRHVAGDTASLMQVWLDNGDPTMKAGEFRAPFLIVPAIARIEPDDVQVVRILRTDDTLPRDRETMLFFNVLELPPTPQDEEVQGQNFLQIAGHARMKFFYRPKGLTPTFGSAVTLLRFALEPVAGDGKLHVRVHNPTPYHITIRNMTLHAGAGTPALATFDEGRTYAPVLKPFDAMSLPLEVAKGASVQLAMQLSAGGAQVRYTTINDEGGNNQYEGVLTRAP